MVHLHPITDRILRVLGSCVVAFVSVAALVIIADAPPAPRDIFEDMHMSAGDEVLGAPFVTYRSDTLGYEVRMPGNWFLDDTRQEFNGDMISDPREHVIVTISEMQDVDLEHLAMSIEQSLRVDPAFTVHSFQKLIWKHRLTLFTDGIRTIGGKRYRTREYNIERANHGGVLNVSVTTQKHTEALYEHALEDMLNSLNVCPTK